MIIMTIIVIIVLYMPRIAVIACFCTFYFYGF